MRHTRNSDCVFEQLGFDGVEAASLRMRAAMMDAVIAEIERQEPAAPKPRPIEKEPPRVASRRPAKTAQRHRRRPRPNRRRTATTRRRTISGR